MANDKINVPVNIDDAGSAAKATTALSRFQKALQNTVKELEKLKDAQDSANKSSAAVKASEKASVGITGASGGVTGAQDYRTQRGVGAATGASARDFARQAEGLGGLVKVYATFAANIYAVSTAFNALKSAADVTNMIKGLDQLGASSGRNLGALAQQLVSISDGAIATRDALDAVAKGSAANLTNNQLLRLATVAKTASQALGRSMPDALDRLTRGVSKIEPELLDELGILVKVKDASDAYARSLGKTAASLTDFEKRQAFTNAVIEQGEKKFGDISLEANAYSRILATSTNLLTSAFQGLNVVLGPVIKFLGEHPTALAGVFGLVATTLIKQAIPAAAGFRQHLEKSAEIAAQKSKKITEIFGEMSAVRIGEAQRANDDELASTKQLLERQAILQKTYADKQTKSNKSTIVAIANKDPRLITATDLKKVEDELQAKEKAGNSARAQSLSLLHARLQRSIELREKEVALLAEEIALETKLNKASSTSLLTEEGRRNSIARRAEMSAEKSRLIFGSYSKSQQEGFSAAWSDLNKNIKESETIQKSAFPRLTGFATSIAGGFAAAAAEVATFTTAVAGVISTVLPILAALAVGFQILDDWLSTNSKATEKFNTAVDSVSTSIESMDRALTAIAKKDLGEQFTPETFQARANAIADLNSNLSDVLTTLDKVAKTSSTWDKIFDFGKGIFGKDAQSKAIESVSKGLEAAINSAMTGPARDEFIARISEITGVAAGSLTAKNIERALDAMSDTKAIDTLGRLNAETSKLTKNQNALASAAVKVSESLKDAGLKADDLINSLIPSDTEAKFGVGLINASIAIGAAIKEGPTAALGSLNDILKDVNKLKVFSPESIQTIEDARKEIGLLNNIAGGAESSIINLKESLAKVSQDLQKAQSKALATASKTGQIDTSEVRALKAREDQIKGLIEFEAKRIEEVRGNPKPTQVLASVLENEFKRGAALLEISVKNAIELAGLSVQKQAASGLTGRGAAEVEASIRLKEIKIQEDSLNQQASLLESQYLATTAVEKNTLAVEKNTLWAQREAAKREGSGKAPELEAKISKLDTSGSNLQKTQDIIRSVGTDYKKLMEASSRFAQTDPLVSGQLASRANALAGISAKRAQLAADRDNALNAEKLKQIAAEFDYRVMINNQQKEATKLAEAEFNARVAEHRLAPEEIEAGRIGYKLLNDSLTATGEQLAREKLIADQKERSRVLGKEIQGTRDLEAQASNAQVIAQQNQNAAIASGNAALEDRKKAYAEQLRNEQMSTDVALGRLTEEQASFERYTQSYNTLLEAREKAGFSDEANKEFDQKVAILDLERERVKEAERLSRIALEQADAIETLNTALETTKSLSDSLSAAFGKVGESIGGIAEALAENAKRQEEIEQNLTKKKLENLHRFGKDTADQRKADRKADDKANKQRVESEFDTYADMAKAAKGFFKEKTVAHKLFAGVEKALHIARLVMDAKETAIQVGSLAKTLAVNTAKQASNIATSVTAFFAALGPFGWIGIAAMFATLAAFGISGKGGGGGYNGPSAEQLQSTAGTGQKYNSQGQLEETGFGRLGESSEKSEAIAKSLELIQEHSFENLEYSNKMLEALLSIRNNIGALTTSIVRVRGLTGGAQAEALINSSGPTSLSNTISKLLNGAIEKIPLVGGLLGGITSGLTAALFGSKKTELKDTGIKIVGQTIGAVIDSGLEAFQYQVIQTTTKKAFGLSKKTSTNQVTTELDKSIKDNFTLVIRSLTDSVTAAADALGMGGQQVVDKIRGVTIQLQDISLKDLKASEIPAYLESIIGEIGSQITEQALGGIEKYKQAGEDLLQTALRLANTVRVFDLQFEQMGLYLSNFSLEAKLSLIELTGGLEEFTSKADFFTQNFLTETERLVPIRKRVTEELGKLGYSAVDTVDEFKQVVLSFGQVGGISADTYAKLMNVSKAFYELYGSAADAESKLKELAKTRKDLEFEIAKKLANAEQLLALTRKKALDELDASLRPLQQYLFALEDEATAKDNLIKAYQANRDEIQQTITKLGTSSKALRDFSKSLLLAKESPLTPQERYLQAKDQFNALLAIAKGPASTKEEIALRDDALSKLQGSASAFLEISAMLNASSTKYTEDFNSVRASLEAAASSLDQQQTDAEKQLVVANKQLDLLGAVNTSVLSVKDALFAYSNSIVNSMIAVSSISSGESLEYWRQKTTENMAVLSQLNQNNAPTLPGLASGGIGRGLTVVGEHGPEIVNFDSPGAVFNNTQSQGMMASFVAPLVEEVQQLRKQVQQMQEQAVKNTEAMIKAGIISNQQNAEIISDSITEAEEKKGWDSRSKLVNPK